MKLKVNDQVMVIAGKDKGKTGQITKIDRKKNRVTVSKVNLRIKHIKKQQNQPGEKISFEAPMSASNVMIIDPKSGKPTRIKHTKLASGKKERLSTKSDVSLDHTTENTVKKAKKK